MSILHKPEVREDNISTGLLSEQKPVSEYFLMKQEKLIELNFHFKHAMSKQTSFYFPLVIQTSVISIILVQVFSNQLVVALQVPQTKVLDDFKHWGFNHYLQYFQQAQVLASDPSLIIILQVQAKLQINPFYAAKLAFIFYYQLNVVICLKIVFQFPRPLWLDQYDNVNRLACFKASNFSLPGKSVVCFTIMLQMILTSVKSQTWRTSLITSVVIVAFLKDQLQFLNSEVFQFDFFLQALFICFFCTVVIFQDSQIDEKVDALVFQGRYSKGKLGRFFLMTILLYIFLQVIYSITKENNNSRIYIQEKQFARNCQVQDSFSQFDTQDDLFLNLYSLLVLQWYQQNCNSVSKKVFDISFMDSVERQTQPWRFASNSMKSLMMLLTIGVFIAWVITQSFLYNYGFVINTKALIVIFQNIIPSIFFYLFTNQFINWMLEMDQQRNYMNEENEVESSDFQVHQNQ